MPEEHVAGTGSVPAAGGGNAGEPGIPKELEKFKGTDGKLDYTKLSQGYLDAEKKATQESQKRAEAERAYNIALTGFGAGSAAAPSGSATEDRGSATDVGNEVDDDDPVTNKAAKPVVQTLLVLTHPELETDTETGEPKNPKFYDGLLKYMRGLPVGIRQQIKNGDFQMTEWAVREYKALTGAKARSASGGGEGGARPNFVEGGSPAGGAPSGTVYSRAEMRKMMLHNPGDYARLSEDYGKALAEGRVKE
jgi:hypothetical protein